MGQNIPTRRQALDNLGDLYRAMGKYAKAEPLLQEALRIYRKVLGPEHPDTVTSLDNLAGLYWTMGEYAKAEPLFQEALRIRVTFVTFSIKEQAVPDGNSKGERPS